MSGNPRARDEATAVVGASAAGLYTACLLARAGAPVSLYEASPYLDPRPRTLIVTRRMLDLLRPLGEFPVINQIRRFELFADGRVATVDLKQPDLVVERADLIRSLADCAQRAGASLCWGRSFAGLSCNGKGLEVRLVQPRTGETEWIRAHNVIGADGAVGKVAEAAGWPKVPTVPLVQATVSLPAGQDLHTTRVWFIPDDTPYFYWLIPESPHRASVGLIGEQGSKTRECLLGFLRRRNLEPLEFQAARIPVYRGWRPVHRRLGGSDIYLVGDAAGHVKVSTVGGIVTGFRGALGVVDAILDRRPNHHLRALRLELDLHLLVRKVLHRLSQNDYCRMFDLLNGDVRSELGALHRDAAARLLWRLVRRQPRLALLALRALLVGRQ